MHSHEFDNPTLMADIEKDGLGDLAGYPQIEFNEKSHRYKVNGEHAPGVTTILKRVFNNADPMKWWGMKIGAWGVADLRNDGFDVPWDDPKAIINLLTAAKKTVNHVSDEAKARGKLVHRAAEKWAEEKVVPNPADFPEEWQGYVRSLALFLTDYQPEFLATEVRVASAEHGYAGTYDARVRIGERIGIIDWKTSKRIYDSHLFQLAAYEVAAVECGAEPSDFQAVVHLAADGDYTYEETTVTADQWFACLACYRAQKAAEEARKLKRAA